MDHMNSFIISKGKQDWILFLREQAQLKCHAACQRLLALLAVNQAAFLWHASSGNQYRSD